MHWLNALFAWIAALPRIAALRASAVTLILAVRDDLRRLDNGEIHSTQEREILRIASACICCAHIFLSAWIHNRARQLAGVSGYVPRASLPTSKPRATTRAVIDRRLRELEARLKRGEQIASDRAAKIAQSQDTLSAAQALSSAFPAQAGNQTRSGRLRSSSIGSALRALAGSIAQRSTPSRATRLMDSAPRDGPAALASLTQPA